MFFSHLRKLAPVEIGPWWSSRRYVYEEMRKLDVRPGDIICRKGNACVYGFIQFSKFICYLTQSEYSHAALVLDTDDDILLADVNTTGLRRQFISDWCDDVRGNDIHVLRFNGSSTVPRLAVENARTVLNIDPSHDNEFLDNQEGINWYCVELVCWCYLRAGVLLCEEIPIKNLPGWHRAFNPFAKLHGVDYNKPVWCVGNKQIGLMSSSYLDTVGVIPFKKVTNHIVKENIFRGA